ncbi:MAG: methylenetetrahydrofolate reductase [Planctomycetota bacterium]
MVSKLKEALSSGQFVITGEVGPPKGVDIEHTLKDAELLKGKVVAVNVTDLQSSVMRIGSLAVCSLLAQRGIEPIFQMTCRDRNRLALQSDLLSAYILGIRNVLCLTGDHPALGDHPGSKPVFELDSVSLLRTVGLLESGKDLAGQELQGAPKFFRGAVVSPCAEDIGPQLAKMERKLKAGAQFFQTQAVYDIGKFETFIKEAEKFNVPILGGIVLLKSASMAKFMNNNVSGISVPEEIIKSIDVPKDQRLQKSIEIAVKLINALKSMVQGIHLMPLGWDKYVPEIIEKAKLG